MTKGKTMELRHYIEKGLLEKEDRKGLADYLGLHPNEITNAKAHQRGIPVFACIKLARLIAADPLAVIAASELVTERKAERKEFWLSFGNPAKTARVAGIAIFMGIVTNFVTPSPAEAASTSHSGQETICIMSNRRKTNMMIGSFVKVCKLFSILTKTLTRSGIEARKLAAVKP